ncbi:MFS transporter [Micrococcoides hystricis]|uniref:MFS transporter n=1 Tax=Micrococcoides hystricis TaxID=1572761 RepID=A0ABV6PDS0_9MICC
MKTSTLRKTSDGIAAAALPSATLRGELDEHGLQRPESWFTRNRSWFIVGLMAFFFALNFADKATVGYAGKQIIADLGLTNAQFGTVGSAFFWLFAVGSILGGLLCRWLNYKWLVAFMMVMWIATMIPLTVPTSFGVLVASRAVLGFAEGPTTAVLNFIVSLLFPPEKRALASGIVTAGSSVGPLIAAPVFTWIILTFDWHRMFQVLVIISVIWLVLWLIVTERTPIKISPKIKENMAALERADDNELQVSFWQLVSTRTFWGLALLCFAGYILTSLKTTWLPLFMNVAMGYPQETVGLLVTLPFLGSTLMAIFSGWLSGRLLRRGHSARVARGVLAGSLLAVGGVAMAVLPMLPPGVLQLSLLTLAFSMPIVPFVVAMQAGTDVAPRKHRALFLGSVVALYSLAGVFAPIGLGVMIDSAASPAAGYMNGFQLVGIFIVVAAIIAAFLINPEHTRAKLQAKSTKKVSA